MPRFLGIDPATGLAIFELADGTRTSVDHTRSPYAQSLMAQGAAQPPAPPGPPPPPAAGAVRERDLTYPAVQTQGAQDKQQAAERTGYGARSERDRFQKRGRGA